MLEYTCSKKNFEKTKETYTVCRKIYEKIKIKWIYIQWILCMRI